MDQTNNVAMSMRQIIAGQTPLPGKVGGSGDDGFHRLLEKVKISRETLSDRTPDAEITPVRPKLEKASAPKQEEPLDRVKKMLEQGVWFTQPDIGCVDIDLVTGEVRGTYEPGEYILAHIGGQTEIIPIADLEPREQLQLQQLLANSGQTADVSDPEADALLEATAPGADNSPAAMLEKVVDEEIGQVAQAAVGEAKPQEKDDDQVELVDVEQGPQRVFHDVEAAPVKVGEAESAEQANEADVVEQVDSQIGQMLQNGESTVTVRLNPENLGEVTVQVSMKSDGVLNVAISARNDDTRALLERHAVNLQEMVSSRTQQSVEVNVQRQQESQQGQNQQSYDGHSGHAQDGRERRQRRQHTSPEDFMQQLRLGLIPTDGEI